jgi:alkylation response protein AidB-like acyl-CoA dehydrogenase
MDFRFTAEEEAFRQEVHDFIETDCPKELRGGDVSFFEQAGNLFAWRKKVAEKGWVAPAWPKEYGGAGMSIMQQFVYSMETARMRAPAPIFIGALAVAVIGPTIIIYGTEEQKQKHIPKILAGEEMWCQGFSEPGSGSDLASLQTRAVKDGDDYVINGQKIWSSFAQLADVGELLVRTDPDAPRHRGISWLIMEMDAPGIEIRPIKTVLGGSEFCEVFFDDVRIPVSNRVGDENDGWRVTNVTLSFERGTAFVGELMDARRQAARLLTMTTDPADRRELGRILAHFDALWALTKRNVTKAQNSGDPGTGAVVLKLAYSDVRDALDDLAMHVLDRAALSIGDVFEIGYFVRERLRTLALPIAAGSSQIQRNIIGERLLGLPKEPRGEPVAP